MNTIFNRNNMKIIIGIYKLIVTIICLPVILCYWIIKIIVNFIYQPFKWYEEAREKMKGEDKKTFFDNINK